MVCSRNRLTAWPLLAWSLWLGLAPLAQADNKPDAAIASTQQQPAASADQANPSDSATPSAFDILESFDDTQAMLEKALQQLQQGQVKPFLVAYGATVQQYVHCTVAMRNYARRCGQASAELDFAIATLDDLLNDDHSVSANWKPQLAETRSLALAQVRSLRNQYESTHDAAARAALGGRMQSLVQRLETMDHWLEPAGSQPADNQAALQAARSQLLELTQQLQSDRQLMQLAASMLTESMGLAQRDIDRGLQLLAVQVQIPRDLDRAQAGLSTVVQSTLNQVRDSRRSARQSMDQMAQDIATPASPGTATLIGQVDRLLGQPALQRSAVQPAAVQPAAVQPAAVQPVRRASYQAPLSICPPAVIVNRR